VTAQGSCAGGTLTVHYDQTINAPTCNVLATSGTTLHATTPGSCGTDLFQGNYSLYDVMYSEPDPGGACVSTGTSLPGGVTYASKDRACVADTILAASCSGNGCPTPSLGDPYRVCVAAPGQVGCPAGPLDVPHVVGMDISFGCSDCSCTMSSTCTGGTVTLYMDGACKKNSQQIPIGVCFPINQNMSTYNSYDYQPGTLQSNCQASGASTAQNVALTNQETICCAQ
jgi:hypothetical protein